MRFATATSKKPWHAVLVCPDEAAATSLAEALPDATDTALFADYKQGAGNPEKLMEAFTRSIPLGRIGQPEDLPGAILFFASSDAAYVTGQVLSVSGGLTMNG